MRKGLIRCLTCCAMSRVLLRRRQGRRGFDDFVIRGFSQSAYAFRDGLQTIMMIGAATFLSRRGRLQHSNQTPKAHHVSECHCFSSNSLDHGMKSESACEQRLLADFCKCTRLLG